jgi:predicted PurR-regulated permease PerM
MEQTERRSHPGIQTAFYTLGSLALVIAGLTYFEGLIKPLVISVLMWFIIDKTKALICKIPLGRKRIPPTLGVILAVFLIIVVVFGIIEALSHNIRSMLVLLPDALEQFNLKISHMGPGQRYPRLVEVVEDSFKGFDPSGILSSLMDSLTSYVTTAFVVLVYVIFFFMEEAKQRLKLGKLFSTEEIQIDTARRTFRKIGATVQAYIWQKTVISFITGALSYLVLLILGVDQAFFWSFLIFILNFIPYLGPLISSLLPALFAVIQTAVPIQFLYVFGGLMLIQIILGNFVEPKIMGKGTNLGPVTVIIALAFWSMLWGIVGMILAIPIASVTVIVLSNYKSTRPLALLLSESGDID